MKAAGKRQKGSRGEKEVERLLDGARMHGAWLKARRVPLSGAMKDAGFGGDVLLRACLHGPDTTCNCPEEKIEVKRRAQGFKRIDAWLADNFAVVYRSDRNEWCITLRLTDWAEPGEK